MKHIKSDSTDFFSHDVKDDVTLQVIRLRKSKYHPVEEYMIGTENDMGGEHDETYTHWIRRDKLIAARDFLTEVIDLTETT